VQGGHEETVEWQSGSRKEGGVCSLLSATRHVLTKLRMLDFLFSYASFLFLPCSHETSDRDSAPRLGRWDGEVCSSGKTPGTRGAEARLPADQGACVAMLVRRQGSLGNDSILGHAAFGRAVQLVARPAPHRITNRGRPKRWSHTYPEVPPLTPRQPPPCPASPTPTPGRRNGRLSRVRTRRTVGKRIRVEAARKGVCEQTSLSLWHGRRKTRAVRYSHGSGGSKGRRLAGHRRWASAQGQVNLIVNPLFTRLGTGRACRLRDQSGRPCFHSGWFEVRDTCDSPSRGGFTVLKGPRTPTIKATQEAGEQKRTA